MKSFEVTFAYYAGDDATTPAEVTVDVARALKGLNFGEAGPGIAVVQHQELPTPATVVEVKRRPIHWSTD